MSHHVRQFEIVHAGALELWVAEEKAARLDDIDRNAETSAEPQQGPGILRDIGFVERKTHGFEIRESCEQIISGSGPTCGGAFAEKLSLGYALRTRLFRQACESPAFYASSCRKTPQFHLSILPPA
jgi:hypothetical protein